MHKTLTGQRRLEAQSDLAAYAAATPRKRRHVWLWVILGLLVLMAAAGLEPPPRATPTKAPTWGPAADLRHSADYARQMEDNCEAWTLEAAPHAHFQYMLRSKTWADGEGWTIWLPFTSYGDRYMTRCTERDGQGVAIILRGPA